MERPYPYWLKRLIDAIENHDDDKTIATLARQYCGKECRIPKGKKELDKEQAVREEHEQLWREAETLRSY